MTRHVDSRAPRTPSALKCYPCLRNKPLPMCPEWTWMELVGRAGIEPATNGLKVLSGIEEKEEVSLADSQKCTQLWVRRMKDLARGFGNANIVLLGRRDFR